MTPLSGRTKNCPRFECATMALRVLPTVGSTTTTNTVPSGKYGVAPYRNRAPSRIENGVTWCVKSTMRTVGMIPYITPRQIATESSTTPKSVMNTMVGGYFPGESLAARDCPAVASSRTASTKTLAFRTLTCFCGIEDELMYLPPLLSQPNEHYW